MCNKLKGYYTKLCPSQMVLKASQMLYEATSETFNYQVFKGLLLSTKLFPKYSYFFVFKPVSYEFHIFKKSFKTYKKLKIIFQSGKIMAGSII